MNNSSKDSIYAHPQKEVGDFVFDENVANVFDDMINRSVPGYRSIISMIGILAQQYVQENSRCYDLGCSLGAGTISLLNSIHQSNVSLVAVDNSSAMVEKCKENVLKVNSSSNVDVLCEDINNITIETASMVIMNFTLQFIDRSLREQLLKKIYDGLLPSGILVLSDKIAFENKQEEEFQTELYHNFKKMNGYSDLEIAQKRTALENVLIPETLSIHHQRLRKVGFENVNVWFQCFNFCSMIAIK